LPYSAFLSPSVSGEAMSGSAFIYALGLNEIACYAA